MEFQNKTVVVTGAARGIGLAIAQTFAQAGARVVIADIDQERGQASAAHLSQQGFPVRFIHTDVAEEKHCQRLMEQAGAQIDILINNAAISTSSTGSIFSLGMADWDRVLAVNLRGPYLCSKLVLPFMPEGGSIINISSTRALMSEPGGEAYAASKGGINSLTHALALSLAQKKIRVNCISPGWIDNSQGEDQLTEMDHLQHPAGRVGLPQDIAAACLYLASPQAGFITGANLVIDGGMTVKMIYA